MSRILHFCCHLVAKCPNPSVTSWTITDQAALSVGFSRQRMLEWVVISFSEDLSNPGIEPASPALEGRFFTTKSLGKPRIIIIHLIQSITVLSGRNRIWTLRAWLQSHRPFMMCLSSLLVSMFFLLSLIWGAGAWAAVTVTPN